MQDAGYGLPRTPLLGRSCIRPSRRAGAATPRPSTTPSLAFLHAEGFRHLRREVGVMVHDLPSVRFTTVGVRHTPFDAYRLVSDSPLAMFGAQGVGGILGYGNHGHVVQCHLPPGERLRGLLPGRSHIPPSEHTTPKRVHGGNVRAVRPDLLHRSGIASFE